MTEFPNRIKRSAIPLSGYVYQNLVGLNLLCDWLEDPALYEWVQFEADHDEVPQGLDDVVAQRWDSKRLFADTVGKIGSLLMRPANYVCQRSLDTPRRATR
jgi:hypothetical protein